MLNQNRHQTRRGTDSRACFGVAVAVSLLVMASETFATSVEDSRPGNEALVIQIAALEVGYLAGFATAFALPPPLDAAPTAAAYASYLELKNAPAWLIAPNDIDITPVSEETCSINFRQPTTSATYKNIWGIFGNLMDDRPYVALPSPQGPVNISHDWGELGTPYVNHFYSNADVWVDVPGATRTASTVQVPIGATQGIWNASTLISDADYVPLYCPGCPPAVSIAAELGWIVANNAADADFFTGKRHGVETRRVQQITIRDIAPPEIHFPEAGAKLRGDIVVKQDGSLQVEAVEPGGVSSLRLLGALDVAVIATDRCDRKTRLSRSTGEFFPIGRHAIKWHAEDPGPRPGDGLPNVTERTMTVEVVDSKPPILLPPPSRVVLASQAQRFETGSPLVFDLADLDPSITRRGPSVFPVDQRSKVVWSAVDGSGNAASAVQWITVKSDGSNTRPKAHSQGLSAIADEPIDIVLTGRDTDMLDDAEGNAISDPLHFSIETRPAFGSFEAPLVPYFIEDFRLENSLCEDLLGAVDPVGQCRSRMEAICAAGGRGNEGVLPDDFPHAPDYVHVMDDNTSYVMDRVQTCFDSKINSDTRRIAHFGADGELLASHRIKGGDAAPSFTLDAAGNLYYVDRIEPRMTRVSADLRDSEVIFLDRLPSGVQTLSNGGDKSVAVDSAGILYVSDERKLYAFDARDVVSNVPRFLADVGGGSFFRRAADMAIDPDDNLYVSDRGEGRIYKFAPSKRTGAGLEPGSFVGWLGKCDENLVAGVLACDDEAHKSYGYTCTDATCGVYRAPQVDQCLVTAPGSRCTAGTGQGQFDEPRGIAIDPNGTLYVTDYNNFRVQRFSSEGVFAGEARSACEGTCFVLGDFGRPEDVSVNAERFYVLDREFDLLHVLETSPIREIDGDSVTVRYHANPDFRGTDFFTFVADDGLDESSAARVTIDVDRNHRPPIAEPGNAVTNEDQAVQIALVASDPDGDFDVLRYTIERAPGHGALSGSGADRTYTPDPDFSGDDGFSFTVSDGRHTTEAVEVAIRVRAVNDRPVVQALRPTSSRPGGAQPSVISAGLGYPVELVANFTDPDSGDAHTATILWDATTLEANGRLIVDDAGTPDAAEDDTYSRPGLQLVEATGGTGILLANHVYTRPGSYDVELCVSDREAAACFTTTVVVKPMVDLMLTATGAQETVKTGQNLMWRHTVANNPPAAGAAGSATKIALTAELPKGTRFVAPASDPRCSAAGRSVTCRLGTLASGTDTSLAIAAAISDARVGETLVYRANVSGDEADYVANGDMLAATTILSATGTPDDADGDGMPNGWEIANGLDPGNPDDARADPDRDGLTNSEEYAQGTDPHRSNSDPGPGPGPGLPKVSKTGTLSGTEKLKLKGISKGTRNSSLEIEMGGGEWLLRGEGFVLHGTNKRRGDDDDDSDGVRRKQKLTLDPGSFEVLRGVTRQWATDLAGSDVSIRSLKAPKIQLKLNKKGTRAKLVWSWKLAGDGPAGKGKVKGKWIGAIAAP